MLTSISISADAEKNLLAQVKKWATDSNLANFKNYMQSRDLAYTRKGATEAGTPEEFQTETRYVKTIVDTEHAFLVSTFLAKQPMLQVISNGTYSELAEKITSYHADNAKNYTWRVEFQRAFKDGLKYNLLIMEVQWDKQIRLLNAKSPTGELLSTVVKEGTKVTRYNLYNSFWDTSVSPDCLPALGGFVGTSTVMGESAFADFVENSKQNIGEFRTNALGALRSKPAPTTATTSDWITVPELYTTAKVSQIDSAIASAMNFTGESPQRRTYQNGKYLVTTVHCRILPSNYGITSSLALPRVNKSAILTLIIVNETTLVYAGVRDEAHKSLPVVACLLRDDELGYDADSFSSNIEPFQSHASRLYSIDLKSSARTVGGVKVFDSTKIDQESVNHNHPSYSVPVKPSGIGQTNLRDLFVEIPFTDPGLGLRSQFAGTLGTLAFQAAGSNLVRAGQFVKGNKTNDQFQESISSANQRSFTSALLLEEVLFTTFKNLVHSNYIQYSNTNFQNVSQDQLATISKNFIYADGLLNEDRAASTPALSQLAQLAITNPEFANDYSISKIMSQLLRVAGLKDLESYKYSEQEKQLRAQTTAQQQQTKPSQGDVNGTTGTIPQAPQ